MLTIAAASFVFLVIAVGYIVYQGHEANLELCQQTKSSRQALRRVVVRARDQAIANAGSYQATFALQAYYARVLAEIPPITCTSSGKPEEPSLVD